MVPERVELGAGSTGRISAERRAFFTTTPAAAVGARGPAGNGQPADRGVRAHRLDDRRQPTHRGTAFDDEDLRLLETLANQAAVALENGQLEQSLAELSRLKEQLRHQAYHDPLTGLANRAMFAEQVDAQLAPASRGSTPVVLFLDLDDFKIVNDTLGHAAGDRLLRRGRRAHQRLRSRRRPGRPARRRRVRGPAPRRARTSTARWRSPSASSRRCRRRSRWRPGDRGWGEHRDRGHERQTTPPTSCCATPTSRCTRRRPPRASVARRCSSRRCTLRSSPATRCPPSCRGAWGAASWWSSTSRSSAGRRADGRRRGARPLAPPRRAG